MILHTFQNYGTFGFTSHYRLVTLIVCQIEPYLKKTKKKQHYLVCILEILKFKIIIFIFAFKRDLVKKKECQDYFLLAKEQKKDKLILKFIDSEKTTII